MNFCEISLSNAFVKRKPTGFITNTSVYLFLPKIWRMEWITNSFYYLKKEVTNIRDNNSNYKDILQVLI